MPSVHHNYENLASRLTVKPPYYAFRRVYADPQEEGIYGDFIPEQLFDGEYAAVSVAEAGRHVAILGTLLGESLSTDNEAGYYLAVNAEITAKEEPFSPGVRGEMMTAHVCCRANTGNRLTVDGQLLYKNTVLLKFVVSYVRLNKTQFGYLCRDAYMPDINLPATLEESPWRHPLPLQIMPDEQEGKLSARINSHDPLLCAGHFEGYPVWPVAIVMSAATQLITTLLREAYYSALQYQVTRVDMQAKKLIPVVKSIIYHAEILGREGSCVNVRCLMRSENAEDVAELTASLVIYDTRGKNE
ncbi:hypothetical protein [Enterobacter adelaidei]